MSKRKYTEGNPILSLAEFEQYKGTWFIVKFGSKKKTLHRGFVESWQTHMLISFLYSGRVFEANEAQDIPQLTKNVPFGESGLEKMEQKQKSRLIFSERKVQE